MTMSGMTRKEAIRLLGVIDAICTMQMGDYGEREHNAMLMAIADMEKQIPKKVLMGKNMMTKTISKCCPRCHRKIERTEALDVWCKYCGQAIDWSEENE